MGEMSRREETLIEWGGAVIALIVMSALAVVLFGLYLGAWSTELVTVGFALAAVGSLTFWAARKSRSATDTPVEQRSPDSATPNRPTTLPSQPKSQ